MGKLADTVSVPGEEPRHNNLVREFEKTELTK